MVEAGTAVTALWWVSAARCRLAPPADTRLTGLLASNDRFCRFCGLRKSGAVTRLGVLPALVLAKSRFPLPSREVMGRVPLEANAVERQGQTHSSQIHSEFC